MSSDNFDLKLADGSGYYCNLSASTFEGAAITRRLVDWVYGEPHPVSSQPSEYTEYGVWLEDVSGGLSDALIDAIEELKAGQVKSPVTTPTLVPFTDRGDMLVLNLLTRRAEYVRPIQVQRRPGYYVSLWVDVNELPDWLKTELTEYLNAAALAKKE